MIAPTAMVRPMARVDTNATAANRICHHGGTEALRNQPITAPARRIRVMIAKTSDRRSGGCHS